MDEQLRKRLEEAEEKYEPDAFDADYILPAREGFIVSGKRAAFRAGAELGYKEAIEAAKEWLFENYDVYGADKLIIASFEAYMRNLWEEKK